MEKIEGHIFTSEGLPEFCKDLDDFEGNGYKKVKTKMLVINKNTKEEVFIYVLK